MIKPYCELMFISLHRICVAIHLQRTTLRLLLVVILVVSKSSLSEAGLHVFTLRRRNILRIDFQDPSKTKIGGAEVKQKECDERCVDSW